jgi:hypothetical protein
MAMATPISAMTAIVITMATSRRVRCAVAAVAVRGFIARGLVVYHQK